MTKTPWPGQDGLFPPWFIKSQMVKSDYAMTYFHISDLLPETNGVMSKEAYEAYFKESGTVLNRYKRYVKENLGKQTAFEKMMNLLDEVSFDNLDMTSQVIDWSSYIVNV